MRYKCDYYDPSIQKKINLEFRNQNKYLLNSKHVFSSSINHQCLLFIVVTTAYLKEFGI